MELGEGGQADQGLADDRPPVEIVVGGRGAVEGVGELVVVIAAPPERADASVVGDPVEPGPGVLDLGPVLQGEPGGEECLLEGILGARLGEEQAPPGVPEELLSVALDERLERPLVPEPGELDQAGVRLGGQEAQGEDRGGRLGHRERVSDA